MNNFSRQNEASRANAVARLYVVYNHEFNRTKVGVSSDPEKRSASFRGATGCDIELVFSSLPMLHAVSVEIKVLDKFRSLRCKYGEWIHGHHEEVVEYAKSLCSDKDVDARCMMYINGMTISDIAREFEVSRQAILKHLKKHGVYVHPDEEKMEVAINAAVPKKKGLKDKSDAYIACTDILSEVPDVSINKRGPAWKRIATNLYASNQGYMVKYFKKGKLIEEIYSDSEAVKKAYNML
jgi:predicted DNA-binding protein YlxM (UPF0122 family)